MSKLTTLPILLIALALLGCADEALESEAAWDGEGKLDDAGDVVNQDDHDDITVIRAGQVAFQPHHTELKNCDVVEVIQGDLVRLDCTDFVESVIDQDNHTPGVMAHRWRPLGFLEADGSVTPGSSGAQCNIISIEVATRTAATSTMKQVGFYFSGSVREPRLFEPSELVVTGQRVGRDGEARTIHQFYAALPCWEGTGSSSSRATYRFKPFVDFAGVDGKIYRNWDTVEHNYVITGGIGPTSFDRTDEVLQ